MTSMLWPPPSHQNPVKLTAISLAKHQKHPFLNHFEEMLGFGLLAKISQSNEIQIKDLFSGTDKYQPPKLPGAKELSKIATQTQTRFVLFGDLSIPTPEPLEHLPVHHLKLSLNLFDSQSSTVIWEQTITFQDFLEEEPTQNRLVLNIQQFNELLAELCREILVALLPGHPIHALEQLSNIPLANTYHAISTMTVIHKKTKNRDKLPLLQDVINTDPGCELAYYHLAKLFRMERQYEQSILNYRKALENCRTGPQTQAVYATDAGIACALLERNDLALQWWQRAIQLNPNYINPYFNIANLYEDQNENIQAADFFKKAQQIAPNDFRTFYNLARIYAKLNAWDDALAQYKKQLDDNNKDPWCHSDIATCYLNLGDIQNATRHLERTVSLDPKGEAGEYAQLILSNLQPA